jgi:hypothetical protein
VDSHQAKGRELEQKIAAYLSHFGYTVATNVVVTGRSGASHELDVVGDKSDGLTSFRLIVECKAWTAPIDKEIVYKLGAVLADLGAAKGVIATLAGWTVQAEQAADQAHIELWGPAELASRLGQVVLSDLQTGAQRVEATGIPFGISAEQAERALQRLAGGMLGMFRETTAWTGPLWLPAWAVQVGTTHIEGRFKKVPRVRRSWNLYEALSGRLAVRYLQEPRFSHVDISAGHLPTKVKANSVASAITRGFEQWGKVTTQAATQRHAVALANLGIDVPARAIAVEATSLVYVPLWAAIFQKGSQERIAVVSGARGEERRLLSDVLTANLQLVRDTVSRL